TPRLWFIAQRTLKTGPGSPAPGERLEPSAGLSFERAAWWPPDFCASLWQLAARRFAGEISGENGDAQACFVRRRIVPADHRAGSVQPRVDRQAVGSQRPQRSVDPHAGPKRLLIAANVLGQEIADVLTPQATAACIDGQIEQRFPKLFLAHNSTADKFARG